MSLAHELDIDIALPFDLKEQMASMHTVGYSLLPLGKGADGKEPTVEFEGRNRFPLAFVAERMAATDSTMYGVRCDGVVVVDIDNMEPDTLRYAENRFGRSPHTVQTQNGEHWYFRAGDAASTDCCIRTGDIQIDIKLGANSCVAGPGSARHDTGFVYTMNGRPLPPIYELPVFCDRQSSRGGNATNTVHKPAVVGMSGRGGVPVGRRNEHLTRKAVEFARNAHSEDDLHQGLITEASLAFETTERFELAEIYSIAKWAWGLRLKDSLFGGRKSAPRIERHEYTTLDQFKNGPDALRLLAELRHSHAGQPGKRFAIATHAMAAADVIRGWSEARYRRAKKPLLEAGLLKQLKKGSEFNGPNEYQLARLPISNE